MLHASLHSLPARRAIPALGACAIAVLAGFAAWSAWTMTTTSREVRASAVLQDAYDRARYAIVREQLAARGYLLQPDPAAVAQVQKAQQELDAALAVVAKHGDAGDRRTVAAVRPANDAALASAQRMFEAANRGDARRVSEINARSRRWPAWRPRTATSGSWWR